MSKRWLLVALTSLFILAMTFVVPALTRAMGATFGYLTVFVIYWLGFCLPLGAFFGGALRADRLSFRLNGARWIPWVAAIQVALVGGVGVALLEVEVSPETVVAAVCFAVVNGFLEEFFWRNAFFEQSRGDVAFQILGLALFTLWHAPLSLAVGVAYEGGPLALIFGAAALGAIWTLMTHKTGSIAWPVLCHVATNAVAFVGLIAVNFAGRA